MHASAHPIDVPATYADLLNLPENVRGEIVDGELIVSPRPAMRHSRAATGIASLLSGPFDHGLGGPGGWWIFSEPELHLRGEAFIPDIAGWRVETLPDMPETAACEVAPDWVCEVLSPSTERNDRVKKLAAYARHKVGHVWLLHPVHRTIEVLRREGDTWLIVMVYDGNGPLRAEPFEAVALPVHLIWQAPAQPPAEESPAPGHGAAGDPP